MAINGYTTTLPLEVFTQGSFVLFVAEFIRLKLHFILENTKITL